MSRPVYPPGSTPAYAPIRPHVQHYTTVRPESVYDPQQARPHPYLPRQTPIHTPDQIAEIHYRNQQLSVARHVSQPMHPQEAIPPPASATGAYHPQSGPLHPVAGPSTRVNQHPAHSYPHPQPTEVSYPVNQPHHPPAPPPGGPGRMTAVPFETLARIVNRMDAVHLSIEERMGKIEDAAKLTNGVAERLEKVESELKANRDKATQEHMSIVTFLDGMSSRFSQRLKIVGDRIERVERGLGPNYFEDTPLPSGSESLATDKLYSGNSVMDKLKNMECLLMELLEKANDPDAYKSEVITEDKGINTDVVHRANAETQCRPPPERCEVAVGESIDSGDFSSAIGTEEHNGRTGLLMNYPAVSGGIVANPQLAAALATPETSELQANLHPATWREEPLSDLSSRSTSPGLTVDELRRMLALKVQAQATANPTGSSSPEASLPRGGTSATSSVPPQTHVPLEQLPSPQPSTPPSPISPVASHTSRLSHDIPLPVFASSDAVSILLEGGNTRSSSLEYVDYQRSSVERLFDDDEDVEYATPEKTKPAEAEKLVEYVPAREGPESEEELDMRGEHIHEASHNVQQSPPASARVPARRRRSPSADSLSSLSTIPSSSPSSSTAVERQIIRSDSLPAPIARPPKKKRRTEPAVSTESSTSALDHLLKKKGSTKKNKQKNEWEKSSKWEVVYGYNGPCDWPELNDDDALYENLLSCDECDCWYHWGCVGLDKDDPQITSEEEPFTCPPCKVSMEKHGIARKVRHTHSGECARPGCTRNLDTGVFFLERVIGRRPANLKVSPPEHPWLFKWADYSPREATWEPEASFPPGRDKFIAEFEDAALAAGLPFDDLDEMILLPEAVEAGWPNINLSR